MDSRASVQISRTQAWKDAVGNISRVPSLLEVSPSSGRAACVVVFMSKGLAAGVGRCLTDSLVFLDFLLICSSHLKRSVIAPNVAIRSRELYTSSASFQCRFS